MYISYLIAMIFGSKIPPALTYFTEFLKSKRSTGILLIICTITSLALTNSPWGEGWVSFWGTRVGITLGATELIYPIEYWINEGLMAVFFLLVGLEIRRAIFAGELSTPRKAMLPVFAALGGMIAPAAFHLILNYGTETASGAGIPMATDIAFSLGVLTLAGKRVPLSLKIFLTAFAIIDDLGAVLLIAIFYSKGFYLQYFLHAIAIFGLLIMFNRLKILKMWAYLIPALFLWYFVLRSGVHATTAGVALAFVIPFHCCNGHSPAHRLEHRLSKLVPFIIIPLFALANTCIRFVPGWELGLLTPNGMGIILGLVIGKPLGILLMSLLAVKTKIGLLPEGVNWMHITGAGFLGGIGFTMSMFIAYLAFKDPAVVDASRLAVLAASAWAGAIGFIMIRFSSAGKKNSVKSEETSESL